MKHPTDTDGSSALNELSAAMTEYSLARQALERAKQEFEEAYNSLKIRQMSMTKAKNDFTTKLKAAVKVTEEAEQAKTLLASAPPFERIPMPGETYTKTDPFDSGVEDSTPPF